MKRVSGLIPYAIGLGAGIALLVGCSKGMAPPLIRSAAAAPEGMLGAPAMPIAQRPIAHSWIKKPPKGTMGTLWATDVEYAAVDMIAYPSGTLIGQVAGFSFPYGDCSDKNGNVYVSDFSLEEGFEIQAGTTKVINSWQTGGETLGCSVSDGGDVAFTNFYPGGVLVFPGGGPTGIKYTGPGELGVAGYDRHGNLFAVCGGSHCGDVTLAELPAGHSSWRLLKVNGTLFGDVVQNMGKDLGIGGVPVSLAGVIQLVKVSGRDATVIKTILFHGSGCSNYVDFGGWASIGNEPNGIITKRPKRIAVTTLDCFPGPIFLYKRNGGDPIASFTPVAYQYDYGLTFTKP